MVIGRSQRHPPRPPPCSRVPWRAVNTGSGRRAAICDAIAASGRLRPSEDLPIAEHAEEIIGLLETHRVVIVAGETGSGKSTQLPKLCLAAGRGRSGMIAHTQPRRVAARSIADRVSSELGTEPGREVGCTVRFQDRTGPDTVVRLMTDGILLAELQRDPELSRYDTVIVDEAHERSLNVDFLLGYLRRLLERRSDLSVVVTSATIDTHRFAAHFAGPDGTPAPIVTVSGRTFPVEIRYRPPETGTDPVQAVSEAMAEIVAEGPGDVLVFLSGEREIHDTVAALRDLEIPGLEVLALYARLSAAEQHRIFSAHAGRRVIVATNVAETSLTVPGIRYVIDAGTARVSRYSRRLKVQRLPIEAISQASADQRAGRCGRVGPGVCIRLYEAEDYEARPAFTEPEILRTNLASVMVQMLAIGLGEVASFPFLEPPDAAAIRDGEQVLAELGAVEVSDTAPRLRLTRLGRRLARLPVDPRLGRMILEAERRDCVREVLVIAAALSIQDPREYPQDPAEAGLARESHRRFEVAGSDLLGLVELWDHLRREQRERSGNQFRKMCRAEYLNWIRVREWQDLYSQLRQVAGQLGIRPATTRAHPDHVHQAVLAGLVTQIGARDGDRRQFRGVRASTFVIGGGSVLAKRPPRWVMATELVETDRLRARRVATIRPEWVEAAAGSLVKRTYGDPVWDASQARAMVPETVQLHGLVLASARRIGLDRVDPRGAHEMFVRHALVDGDWASRHPFGVRNDEFRDRMIELETRSRRTGLLHPDDEFAFFCARVPSEVVSGRHFDRWWRGVVSEDPHRLDLDESVVSSDEYGIRLHSEDYPDHWMHRGLSLTLRYRYEPGHPLDGTFVEIPLLLVNQIDASGWDWHVPGHRRELVATLIRTLPKTIRRDLQPLGDTIEAVLAALPSVPTGRLVDAVIEGLASTSGVRVAAKDLDASRLPPHLRMGFIVVDDTGVPVDAGRDLDAVVARVAIPARSAVVAHLARHGHEERDSVEDWDVGELPATVEVPSRHGAVRAWPRLVDEGDRVALRFMLDDATARRAHGRAVRRLLLRSAPSVRRVLSDAPRRVHLALGAAGDDARGVVGDCILVAIDEIRRRHPEPREPEAFSVIRAEVERECGPRSRQLLDQAAAALTLAVSVDERLDGLRAASLRELVDDARSHRRRLIRPGFVTSTGADRLGDLSRYLAGLEHRLERLDGDIDKDARRLSEIHPLERRYRALVRSLPGGAVPAEVIELGWQLEELRLATFAQALGARPGTSVTRCHRALLALGA